MQPAPTRGPPRPPGSFSPLPGGGSSPRPPPPRRVESFSSDDTTSLNVAKARNVPLGVPSPTTPIYASFTSQSNSSSTSLHQQQNFSRPTLSTAQAAARSVASAHSSASDRDPSSTGRERTGMSPLSFHPPTTAANLESQHSSSSTFASVRKGHSRKNSASAGLFDSTLPSTSTSNLSQIGTMGPLPARRELSASQIAAQAAIKHHQSSQQVPQLQPQGMVQQGGYNYQSNQNQHQTVLPQHSRQRSQTVPAPGQEYETSGGLLSKSSRSSSRGPLSPPLLSVTEASAPRESGFGGNQGYHNGLLGSSAAAAAANIVFPRSGQSSPKLPPPGSAGQSTTSLPVGTTTPTEVPDKPPLTTQRSKVKLFSRPVKIGIKTGDPKEKPLPSPGKALGQAFSNLQRGNFSTTSLDSTAHSFYSLANSSAATIKAVDTNKPPPVPEKEGKEKKHHFLSRQKHKLKDKDDFHLPLSSASSNSRPTDPSAPSSLYNFSLPPSPGPNTGFKKMSG